MFTKADITRLRDYRRRIHEVTGFDSTDPIPDLFEALVLLFEGRDEGMDLPESRRRLRPKCHLRDGMYGPAIEIVNINTGFGTHDIPGKHIFPITSDVFEQLLSWGVLSGAVHISGIDDSEMHLNEMAIKLLADLCE